MSGRRRQAGFTLLEVIVAFTIATGTLGLLYRIQGNTTATIARAGDTQLALELATSLLAELDQTVTERNGVRSGSFDKRFRWQAEIEARNPDETTALILRTIEVEVAWRSAGRERTVSLRTLKPWPASLETPIP